MKLEGQELLDNYMKELTRYFIINVISRRARALVDGEKPLVDPQGSTRPSELAGKELEAGKLKVSPKATRNKLVDIIREVTDRS
jgi:DNA-directed RNA polymerase subunit K/omega